MAERGRREHRASQLAEANLTALFLDPKKRAELDGVPVVLARVTNVLREKGPATKNIFTQFTRPADVTEFKTRLEKGEVDVAQADPYIVADVFKLFLKELPQPLTTFELYDSLCSIHNTLASSDASDIEQRLSYLKELLMTLPDDKQLLLCFVSIFLNRLKAHSAVTKCTAQSMAVLFAPAYMRPKLQQTDHGAADVASCSGITRLLIDHADVLCASMPKFAEISVMNEILRKRERPSVKITIADEPNLNRTPKTATISQGKRKAPKSIRGPRGATFVDYEEAEEKALCSSTLLTTAPGWLIDRQSDDKPGKVYALADQDLLQPYFQRIHAKEHFTYVAIDQEFGPMVLCGSPQAEVLLMHSYGRELISAPPQSRKNIPNLLKFIRTLYPSISAAVKFRENNDSVFADDLLNYEKRAIPGGSKFGILYRKAAQTDEDEMFSNSMDNSAGFQEFLALLGERITLQGFKGFKGGLDVRTNSTGQFSYFTTFQANEIMFHVAPLLPFNPNDKQQLERKRHIGNDVVVMVYQDDHSQFNPAWLRSEMNHVFIIISPGKDKDYHVAASCKQGVKHFDPPTFSSTVRASQLREYLLSKCVNGERAALRAPVFDKKLAKTRRILLEKMIVESYGRKRGKEVKAAPEDKKDDGKKKGGFGLLQLATNVLSRGSSNSSTSVSSSTSTSTATSSTNVAPTPLANATAPEEEMDLVTLAASKKQKKELASKVDELYADENVSRALESELGALTPADDDRPTVGNSGGHTRSTSVQLPTPSAVPLTADSSSPTKVRSTSTVSSSPSLDSNSNRPSSSSSGSSNGSSTNVAAAIGRQPVVASPPSAAAPAPHVTVSAPEGDTQARALELSKRFLQLAEELTEREMGEAVLFLAAVVKLAKQVLDSDTPTTPTLPAPPGAQTAAALNSAELRERAREATRGACQQLADRLPTSSARQTAAVQQLMAQYDVSPFALRATSRQLLRTQSPQPPARGSSGRRDQRPSSLGIDDDRARQVRERLLDAARTAARSSHCRLIALHRLSRDGGIAPQQLQALLTELQALSPALHSTSISALALCAKLRAADKQLEESVSLETDAQARAMFDLARAINFVNKSLTRVFSQWHIVLPTDCRTQAESIRDRCIQCCCDLLAFLDETQALQAASAISRVFAAVDSFLLNRTDIVARKETVSNFNSSTSAMQLRVLRQLGQDQVAEITSKLHAVAHHVQQAESDGDRLEAVTNLELIERSDRYLEEFRARIKDIASQTPTRGALSARGISDSADEPMSRLRAGVLQTLDEIENRLALFEVRTSECESLLLANQLGVAAVNLRRLREAQPLVTLPRASSRVDRDEPVLSDAQREKLTALKQRIKGELTDMRGFIVEERARIQQTTDMKEGMEVAKPIAAINKQLIELQANAL